MLSLFSVAVHAAEPAPASSHRAPAGAEWTSLTDAIRGVVACWSRVPGVTRGSLTLEVVPQPDGTSRSRWWSAVSEEPCMSMALRHVALEADDPRPVGVEVWIGVPVAVAWGVDAPRSAGGGEAVARPLLDAWSRCTAGRMSPSRVPIRIDLPAGGVPSFAPLGGDPPEWAACLVEAAPVAELEKLGTRSVLVVPPG